MKTAVIIQARMGSKRFPGKVMADLCGKPVISHVIEACEKIKADHIIMDVPKQDVILSRIAAQHRITCTNYQENGDLLEAYCLAARQYAVDTIIRITGDCPLLNPDLCNRTVDLYRQRHCVYAAIAWPLGGFPMGYGCEVFSRFALELANAMATDPADREHVTLWMLRNLQCKFLQNDKNESHLNFCVDYPEDIPRLEKILRERNERQ